MRDLMLHKVSCTLGVLPFFLIPFPGFLIGLNGLLVHLFFQKNSFLKFYDFSFNFISLLICNYISQNFLMRVLFLVITFSFVYTFFVKSKLTLSFVYFFLIQMPFFFSVCLLQNTNTILL